MPSLEIARLPAAYGLVTEVTCGRRATWPSICSTCARTAGEASVPPGVLTTIWSESPDWAGKRLESRSAARCASVPGSEKLFAKWLPTTFEIASAPTRTAIQSATTRRR